MKKYFLSSLILFFVVLISSVSYSMDVPLQWDSLSGAVGYKVYYDSNQYDPYVGVDATEGISPIDVGNVTSVTIHGLSNTQTHYFVIVGYDAYGLEGPPSSEIRTLRIASITSTSDDGTYFLSDSVNVEVHFPQMLNLQGGNMNLSLNSGGSVTIAPFNGMNTVSGNYVVQEGESSADLNVTNIYLDPNTVLVDSMSREYCLSVPTGTNLADLKNIVIATPSLGEVTGATTGCP